MKKLICMLMSAVLLVSLTACGKIQQTGDLSDSSEVISETTVPLEELKKTVVITVKDYGTIEVELDPSAAPVTVENFLKLAGEGFYDGLTFHRIIDGFMIQGGDPNGNGTGGSRRNIKGEFSDNGVENPIGHTRGVISMARARDFDSASSQFFIVHQDSPFLDGQYAGFGRVTAGMEVVDAICQQTRVEDGNGTVSPQNQPVIQSVAIKG